MKQKQFLFIYGTLQFKPILEHVINRAYTENEYPAILENYRCRKIIGEHYPAIIPDDSASTIGKILSVSDLDLMYLDRYEGIQYARIKVRTMMKNTSLDCWTYCLKTQFYPQLSDDRWSLEDFTSWYIKHYPNLDTF